MILATEMKGGGYYDSHSQPQRAVNVQALSLIDLAVDALPSPDGGGPVTVVDYGCSEGGNSVFVMNEIVRRIASRQAGRSICIVYNDLPTNDFNQLFRNVRTAGDGTADNSGTPVYVFASGISFFQPVCPPASVHLAYSANALHWLSDVPTAKTGEHCFFGMAEGACRQSLAARADLDWREFLGQRAAEVVAGGRLVVSMLGNAQPDNLVQFEDNMLRSFNAVLRELADEGSIERSALASFVFPIYYRTLAECLEPLRAGAGDLAGKWRVEHARLERVACPLRAAFQQSGDRAWYADQFVRSLRSWSEGVLAQAFLQGRSQADREKVLNDIYGRLFARVLERPDEHFYIMDEIFMLLSRSGQSIS